MTHPQRAIYVAEGQLRIAGRTLVPGALVVLQPGAAITVEALAAARFMLLGGAPLEGPRFIDWNFVASSEARLEQAKDDWKNGRFAKVPGDETEFIPLPSPEKGRRLRPSPQAPN